MQHSFKFPEIWSCNELERKISLENYLRVVNDNVHFKKVFVYWYRPSNLTIDLEETKRFFEFLHAVPINKDEINILPIFIDMTDVKFVDKLVYILFETMIYHIIHDKNWIISVIGDLKPENCSNSINTSSLAVGNWSTGIVADSNFTNILNKKNQERCEKYKYSRSKIGDLSSTRCFVSAQSETKESLHASDIYEFLEESKELIEKAGGNLSDITNTIFEIIANCAEHTNSQYIYDIDIKKVIHGSASKLKGNEYVAINIAIWDFSKAKLGDAIKRKIECIENTSSKEEYNALIGEKEYTFEKLLQSKKVHEKVWRENDAYDADDFFALAAFQPGVTGRPHPGSTGGAGLAHVLDFLLDFSDIYRCYCLTGDTIINLDKKFLTKDKDGWYSFNNIQTANFVDSAPSKLCVSKSDVFYAGTAFFLHLELNGGTNG